MTVPARQFTFCSLFELVFGLVNESNKITHTANHHSNVTHAETASHHCVAGPETIFHNSSSSETDKQQVSTARAKNKFKYQTSPCVKYPHFCANSAHKHQHSIHSCSVGTSRLHAVKTQLRIFWKKFWYLFVLLEAENEQPGFILLIGFG